MILYKSILNNINTYIILYKSIAKYIYFYNGKRSGCKRSGKTID